MMYLLPDMKASTFRGQNRWDVLIEASKDEAVQVGVTDGLFCLDLAERWGTEKFQRMRPPGKIFLPPIFLPAHWAVGNA
jgi:hypothetical protein